MTNEQVKKVQDRNHNIVLAAVAVALVLLIGYMNKNETKIAEQKNVIRHGSVPYWMQK